MSQDKNGTVVGFELVVGDHEAARDYYQDVLGWQSHPVDMGEYNDFMMMSPAGEPVAGICRSAGQNTGFPTGWLSYIQVADLDETLALSAARGGVLVRPVQGEAPGFRYAVIRDPFGAVLALIQQGEEADGGSTEGSTTSA